MLQFLSAVVCVALEAVIADAIGNRIRSDIAPPYLTDDSAKHMEMCAGAGVDGASSAQLVQKEM